jgi:amidophosphoribosyltransferase
MSRLIQIDDDHFHDHCGVFGIFGHPEAAKMAYLGLYALQHRGQESAGIASTDGTDIHVHKSLGHVQEIFTPDVIAQLPGEVAIGHTRYSTAGDTSLMNAQPVVIDCNKGKLALGHNGNLTNAQARASRLHFSIHQRYGSDRSSDRSQFRAKSFRSDCGCAQSSGRGLLAAVADAR